MPTDPDAPSPPAAPARVLSASSFRARILGALMALAILPTTATGVWMVLRFRAQWGEAAVQRVTDETAAKVRALAEFLETIQQDLRFRAFGAALPGPRSSRQSRAGPAGPLSIRH